MYTPVMVFMAEFTDLAISLQNDPDAFPLNESKHQAGNVNNHITSWKKHQVVNYTPCPCQEINT